MSKRAADASLSDPERLFASLAASRGLVLAVSGGADSTALMVLTARWPSRPPTLVVTVDHGLRPEGAAEAALVAANAARLGLPCRVMRTPQWPGRGNVQDWARRARYACLLEAARGAGADSIAVAHHREDQAETFLLRLARGSGVYGLAAMREETELDGVRVFRPLLHVPRAALARVVAESGLPIVADPSNADPRFDRVRMRELASTLDAYGLSPAGLAQTAGRLGRASAALDVYARAVLRENFRVGRSGIVSGRAEAVAEPPEEVGLRALALLLAAVGGAEYGPRLDRLEALWRAIVSAGPAAAWKRTLHGVVVQLAGSCITVHREWGRSGIPAAPAPAGTMVVWDRRFEVRVPDVPGELHLGALGDAGHPIRSKPQGSAIEGAACRTLPGLYRGDHLIAAPEGIAIAVPEGEFAVLPTECLVGRRLGLLPQEVPGAYGRIDHDGREELMDGGPQFTLASTVQQPIYATRGSGAATAWPSRGSSE